MPATMFDKIWDAHTILEREGNTLLHVAFHLCHDGSAAGFAKLKERGIEVRRPDRMAGTPDHYVPTTSRRIE
ncbi:MAG: 3-isopropylmalate dehydratase large subunit, partial [Alphaproteobacteria bacterium]|nr:3-isopropylmalate dehydratase large subunit [Alphaproteobacteria bacterium]